MDRPVISVIIPVYNSESTLARCLASVLSQSWRQIEVLLVDDGSTDGSGALCDGATGKDSRVSVFHQENMGQSLARNLALKHAKGIFAGFVDADDYIEPDMYEKLYASALANRADGVLCGISRRFENGRVLRKADGTDNRVFEGRGEMARLLQAFTGHNPNTGDGYFLCASACRGLYSLDKIRSLNIAFRAQSLSEDLFFNLDFFSRCERASTLAEPLYFYCDRNIPSVTALFRPEKFELFCEIYNTLLSRAGLYGIPLAEMAPRAAGQFLGFASVCVKQRLQYADKDGYGESLAYIRRVMRSKEARRALDVCQWWRLRFPLSLFCALLRLGWARILARLVRLFLKFPAAK